MTHISCVLSLKKKSYLQFSESSTIEGLKPTEFDHTETHRQLSEGLRQDGGESVTDTGLELGMLVTLQHFV